MFKKKVKCLIVRIQMGVEEVQNNSPKWNSEALRRWELIYFGSVLYPLYRESLLEQAMDKYLLSECFCALSQLSHLNTAVTCLWELLIVLFTQKETKPWRDLSDLPQAAQLRTVGPSLTQSM